MAAALVVVGVLFLTRQPWLGLHLEPTASGKGLQIIQVDSRSPLYNRLYQDHVITATRLGKAKVMLGKDSIQSLPHFSHHDYLGMQQYLAHQGKLQQSLQQDRVGVLDQGDQLYWVRLHKERPIDSLPVRFWAYSVLGVLGFMLGVGIWSRNRGRTQARVTVLTGLALLLYSVSSAVLSSRGLYLPMESLNKLLLIQRGSMYIFIYLVIAVLALAPRGTQNGRIVLYAAGVITFLWMNDVYQIIQWMGHTHVVPVFIALVTGAVIAARQWRLSLDWPEQHANYKWLLLCLVISLGFGLLVHLLPTIYHQSSAMNLWVWTGIFFFIYLGLLMGMYGERRFNIERWWLETLAWFTGGLFVIGLDAALVYLLQLSPDTALGIAVLAIGWAYLPARHWFWRRVVRGERKGMEEYLPVVLETLLSEERRVDLSAQWRELLHKIFEPMQITIMDKASHRVAIQQSGLAMHVPSVHGDRTIELSWRKRGAKLFTLADARLAESLLRLFRNRDSVTGLPNKNVLIDRIRQSQSKQRNWSLVFIRMKRMKSIMNLIGSDAGEDVLKQIPKRLQRAVKRTNVYLENSIAYIGNGEFAIFLPGYKSERAMPIVESIADELRLGMRTGEHTIDLSAFMGIASYPEHGGDAEVLLQNAETAMLVSKESGKEYAVYNSEFEEISMRKMAISNGLRRAIGRELLLHYQPKLELNSNRICSVEALVRWKHRTLGMISPTEFIPLAEQNSAIKPLTYWALDYALQQCADWHHMGKEMGVAVNISVQSLQDKGFTDHVLGTIHKYGLSPESLILEITENELMVETSDANNTLKTLSQEGVRLSIDDFGTGYSSFSYLKRMPISELKIDQSLIKNIAIDQEDASIVKAIINLSHTLGLRVVSEGVEDQRTLQMLTTLGTDMVQGYYIHKPIASDELNQWLNTWEGMAATPTFKPLPKPQFHPNG
ncbi:MAG: EAL domain-containing protein [Gammaproteobacteria bacterium]|nr:EAL domain-containing protein [Gammaproteobacteria bacterium]